jgi:predicted dehydrogenase
MNQPPKIAIIGCGWAGIRHARAFIECGAEIAWAVDTNPQRAEALRAQTGGTAQVSTDFRAALANDSLDAVDICLPHNLHGAVAIPAAQANKHILCEKPIAATLEEADAMIAAAEKASVTLMIAENERYNPAIRKIQALVQQGVIGKVALLQMTRQCYLRQSFLEDRPWFLDVRAAAGGAMTAGGVHDFEKARMLVGEIESVSAKHLSGIIHQHDSNLSLGEAPTFEQGDPTGVDRLPGRDDGFGVIALASFQMRPTRLFF